MEPVRNCLFCTLRGEPTALFLTQPGRPPRPAVHPLCHNHLAILRQAGVRGRVHKPTGIRWRLADEHSGIPR